MESQSLKSESPSTDKSETLYPRFSTPSEEQRFLMSLREDFLAGAAQMSPGNEVLDLKTGQPISLPYQLPSQK